MGCLVVMASVAFPRITLGLLWILTPLVDRAFQTWVLPLLGLLFAPFTTMVYILAWRPETGVSGGGWVWVFLGLLIDLGVLGFGRSGYSASRVRARDYRREQG
jgi:hypothetical protein